jgi:hypothetical protein
MGIMMGMTTVIKRIKREKGTMATTTVGKKAKATHTKADNTR